MPPNNPVTPLAFMDGFTDQEQLTIAGAALQDPATFLWLLRLVAAPAIEDTARAKAGVDAMRAAQLISQARADEAKARLEQEPPKVLRKVTKTVVERGHDQHDGSFWVTEGHFLSDGSVRTYNTRTPAGTDYEAVAAQRAADLNAALMEEHADG